MFKDKRISTITGKHLVGVRVRVSVRVRVRVRVGLRVRVRRDDLVGITGL